MSGIKISGSEISRLIGQLFQNLMLFLGVYGEENAFEFFMAGYSAAKLSLKLARMHGYLLSLSGYTWYVQLPQGPPVEELEGAPVALKKTDINLLQMSPLSFSSWVIR